MGEVTHLSKLAIQESRDEVNEGRDRQIMTALFVGATNAALADGAFLIANRKWRVGAVRIVHGTAGTDVGAVNVAVKKCTGTQAPSAGVAVHTGTHDLKGAIDTVEAMTLTATLADLELAIGNRLAVDFTGVLTAVAGVVVSVDLIPV